MPVRRRHFDQLATAQSWSSPAAVIAHIDLDAFYAQCLGVHHKVDPAEPLGCRQWNALIAVNYPAREFGIKRGASVDEARRMCPGIHLPHVATFKKGELDWGFHDAPDANDYKVSLDHFRRESRKIFAVFKQHFSLVEKAGIDEGFVDLGAEVHAEALRRHPELLAGRAPDDELGLDENELMDIGAELVASVRQHIYTTMHYTCSAGIAQNKLLAKLGSGFRKPFNQTVVHIGDVPEFLKHFKITDAWGWGGKQGRLVLADLGVKDELEDQCGYVREHFSLADLQRRISGNEKLARSLYEMVRGIHQSEVQARTLIKSMIAVKDFRRLRHLRTREDVDMWLRVFSADLAGRLADLHEDLGNAIVPKTIAVRQSKDTAGLNSKQQPFVLRGTSIPQLREQIFEQSKAIAATFITLPCTYLVVEVSQFHQLPKERLNFESAQKPRLPLETEYRERLPQVAPQVALDIAHVAEEGAAHPADQTPAAGSSSSSSNSSSSGGDGGSGGGDDNLFVEDLWRCPQCGSHVKFEEQQEHTDWHFAVQLQNASPLDVGLNQTPPLSPSKRRPVSKDTKTRAKKKKVDADQKNILDFFKK